MDRELLFYLDDGRAVYRGDILYHPDMWYCTAEFVTTNVRTVTVRAPNGAVPTVNISDLCRNPPPERPRCSKCNQLLPE